MFRYMGLADCVWCDVIVLVGGNELRRFEYEFRPIIYADIEARVEQFWQSVRDGKVPKADYRRDGDAIMALHPNASDEGKEISLQNRAIVLATEWLSVKQQKGRAPA